MRRKRQEYTIIEKGWYSLSGLRKVFNRSHKSLYRWFITRDYPKKYKNLPRPYKVGKFWMVRYEDIDKFMRENGLKKNV